jgi:hypothetical protein
MHSQVSGTRCILAAAALGLCLWIGMPAGEAAAAAWRNYVGNCLDTLLTQGTDRYGPVQSDMLVSILDVNTHECPQNPLTLDQGVYCSVAGVRVVAGSNFWYDQETIRAMYRLSSMTGDPHYAAGANRVINAFFDHAIQPNTGTPIWGSHTHYDVFTEQMVLNNYDVPLQEILIYDCQWGRLYDQRPAATKTMVDGLWNRAVVNKTTGQFNRHDDNQIGCDFAFAGGSYISAFAAMYSKTQDPVYLNRARTVENWHWSNRNPVTNLVADAPTQTGRFDGTHCFTIVTGPYAWQLLNTYQQTGDSTFLNHAAAYLKAYDHYGWDSAAGTYYAELNLNGTPVPYRPKGDGYDACEPTGHVDMWKGTFLDYEFPLIAAQSTVRAYELTHDPALLTAANHWATAIEQNLPITLGYRWHDEMLAAMPEWSTTGGSYAEDYGRVISFFVHMYDVTNDTSYLQLAEQVGQDAIDKLYVNGIFRGHPAKPYYESTNGVGVLLDAMLELDAVATPEPDAFTLLAMALIGLSVHARRRRR